jgi:hypothetical protein
MNTVDKADALNARGVSTARGGQWQSGHGRRSAAFCFDGLLRFEKKYMFRIVDRPRFEAFKKRGVVRYFIAAGTQEGARDAIRPHARDDVITVLAPVIVPNLAGFYLAYSQGFSHGQYRR